MKEESENECWCAPLYQAQASALILYGRSLGLSHAESEDVLHEVFQALLRLNDAPETPDRYAVRAFRHRALNRHRSVWRRLTHELQSRQWFEPDAETSENERNAMSCLARLPSEQREVIVLKFWHDHTFEEIGGLLGISPHTAAARYRYGVAKLRARLQPHIRETHTNEPYLDDPTAILATAKALSQA